MVVKRKPKRLQRARDAVRRHPWTWGTIATVVGILGVVIPGALWVIARFQTAADARSHADRDEQKFAWVIYGQAKTNVILLRNRLNDCNSKPITKAERPACDQYRQEYEEESQRARDLYKAAMDAGKDRQ